MGKFRSKPVEVEAVQWNKMGDHPAVEREPSSDRLQVFGAQGWSQVKAGDWIITEPRGDGFYPCNPEVFAAKYEPVDEGRLVPPHGSGPDNL